MSQTYHTIQNVKCLEHRRKGETISAIKFTAPCFLEPQWMPFSQIGEDSEVWKAGDEGTLLVTEWFANKMDWI